MPALYDRLGVGYHDYRRPDPRIAAIVNAAIGDSRSIINVGAGGGSYEPCDRRVVAVEPSRVMIAQRPSGAATAVQACAEALPFATDAFDCAMAMLTIHHWNDSERGIRELARVARRKVVLLTWIGLVNDFWLMDYLPQIGDLDAHLFPTLAQLTEWLGPLRVVEVPIPHDCSDGFMCAYWRRPEAYLDAGVRRAISTFARVDDAEPGLARLRQDLDSGAWLDRYGHLLDRAAVDFGYRVVVSGG